MTLSITIIAFALGGMAAQQELPPAGNTSSAGARPATAATRSEVDVAYAAADPGQQLDLYLPAPAAKPFATVLFVYGGGWHGGSRKNLAGVGENLQAQGFACALVGHRLCPPHRWPAMIEDVAAAFAWVHGHIAERGGDPARIAVAGHSSGAQLVLLLASDAQWLQAHSLSPAAITGVVGLSTPVDLRPAQEAAHGRGFGDTLMAGRGADVFDRDPAVMAAASPCTHLSKDLPPTLLVVGETDFPMLLGNAQDFAAAAQALGLTVPVLTLPKAAHGRVPAVLLANADPLQQEILRFLAAPATFAAKSPPATVAPGRAKDEQTDAKKNEKQANQDGKR